MSEAIAYHAAHNLEAKASMGEPVGFATLIDFHRVDYVDPSMRYQLPESALPTADELLNLGIQKVVQLNERLINSRNYPANVVLEATNPSGFKDRFLEYQRRGLELHFLGIDKR